MAQLDRLARHNRQGSYRTRERYYEAMKRFCAYLAEEWHLQKLANVSGKHLVGYVVRMQEEGKSASTIKTDLAAIRFFHDKIDGAKYTLPNNDELGVELERRRFGGVDRTWSGEEFDGMVAIAEAEGRRDYVAALCLARGLGLRIHECFRIDTAIAEVALRNNAITIKGKGGKVRTVPIEDERVREVLRERLKATQRGHKLLVPDDKDTDVAITEMQQFIRAHRAEVEDPEREAPMTFHGNRHSYAARKYDHLMRAGAGDEDAHYKVSRLLGHERSDVTNIYLASADGSGKDDSLVEYGGPDANRQ